MANETKRTVNGPHKMVRIAHRATSMSMTYANRIAVVAEIVNVTMNGCDENGKAATMSTMTNISGVSSARLVLCGPNSTARARQTQSRTFTQKSGHKSHTHTHTRRSHANSFTSQSAQCTIDCGGTHPVRRMKIHHPNNRLQSVGSHGHGKSRAATDSGDSSDSSD